MIDTTDCKKTSWMIGAGAGLLVTAWLLIVSHYGFFAAVFLGFLTFGLFGSFLVWAFCEGAKLAAPQSAAPTAKPVATPPIAAAPAAPMPVAAQANAASVVAPAQPVASQPAAGIAAIPAKAEAMSADVAKAEAPATAKATLEPAAKAAPAVATDAEPVAASGDEPAGVKPKGLKAARKGGADDLKLIEGIGPKLEERLNEWGIFHFDQIAAWGADEVAFADQNVPRFKGRATRDKWVAQAKLIVSEGVDAFLERAKTNDY